MTMAVARRRRRRRCGNGEEGDFVTAVTIVTVVALWLNEAGSLVCMGRHAMPCRILLNSSAAAKSDDDNAHPTARNFEIGLPSLCNVTNNDGLSLIQKRFPAGLAQFFIGYSIMDVWMMFELIEKFPTSSRTSGKSTPIRKWSCKSPCAIIEEDSYIVCFIQCQSPANLSRGNHFRSAGGSPSLHELALDWLDTYLRSGKRTIDGGGDGSGRVGAIKFTIAEGRRGEGGSGQAGLRRRDPHGSGSFWHRVSR
ncbi:hypothetical protein ALC53_00779 [Atta colombica]|uniref:Uncharacterized protein n=1 Tax=Atta colombica TaxID=520822 RepID=A0A195BUM8_9HYME|nr:hypothetical protein ALC53_00779 [Atta colombica]